LGCPNFFKYHPEATLGEYCGRFGYNENVLKEAVVRKRPDIRKSDRDTAFLSLIKEMDIRGETDAAYKQAFKDTIMTKTENAVKAEKDYNGLSYPGIRDLYFSAKAEEEQASDDSGSAKADKQRHISEGAKKSRYSTGIYTDAIYEFCKTSSEFFTGYLAETRNEDLPANADELIDADDKESITDDGWEIISISLDMSVERLIKKFSSCTHLLIKLSEDNPTSPGELPNKRHIRAFLVGISEGALCVRIRAGIRNSRIESVEPMISSFRNQHT